MQVNGSTRISFSRRKILILVHSILKVREYENYNPQIGSGFSYRGGNNTLNVLTSGMQSQIRALSRNEGLFKQNRILHTQRGWKSDVAYGEYGKGEGCGKWGRNRDRDC